jgi:hypothetical protein
MSQDTNVIPVPTNGDRPHPAPVPGAPTASIDDDDPADDVFTRQSYGIAFSPGQLAVGFGVIAALVLLVRGRRSRRP